MPSTFRVIDRNCSRLEQVLKVGYFANAKEFNFLRVFPSKSFATRQLSNPERSFGSTMMIPDRLEGEKSFPCTKAPSNLTRDRVATTVKGIK